MTEINENAALMLGNIAAVEQAALARDNILEGRIDALEAGGCASIPIQELLGRVRRVSGNGAYQRNMLRMRLRRIEEHLGLPARTHNDPPPKPGEPEAQSEELAEEKLLKGGFGAIDERLEACEGDAPPAKPMDLYVVLAFLDMAISEVKAQLDLSEEGVADTMRWLEAAYARLEGYLQ